MHSEYSFDDLNVINNALAALTAIAACISPAKASAGRVAAVRAWQGFRSTVTRAARYTGFTEQLYVNTAGMAVQEQKLATELAEIEHQLAELTAKHVQLVHAISDFNAQNIRSGFSADHYENLKNVALALGGLEANVSQLIHNVSQPQPYLHRLSNAVTEYRLAISDLLMILDQCFNEARFTESKTHITDAEIFTHFSLH